ncbi:ABC transporter ATP-binding protein [Duganella sp. P38]|uniref:ABC transporter ATP-binding protein n=1 Tax=Duganella sp. P38 TaxID=3423949 RepID=UPI003D7B060D
MTSHLAPTPTDAAVSLRGIQHRYGAFTALQDVSFDIARGGMFGLIGHNGAGKSTLFKLMLGLVTPSAGTLHVLGQNAAGAGFRQTRRRIGYLPESFVTYDNLSGREVLHFFADLKRIPRAGCAALLEQVGLTQAASRAVQTYSKGMRQRLGLAQSLLGEPDIIFLDEPTNGLDPQGIADFYAILRTVQGRGATIVITSHILAEIQHRVDQLLIMQGGKVAVQGTLAQLRAGMDTPAALTITATVPLPLQAATRAALAASPVALELEGHGEQLRIRCAGAGKMAVLRQLSGCADDITIQESTLEQVFLGYGGAHARTH